MWWFPVCFEQLSRFPEGDLGTTVGEEKEVTGGELQAPRSAFLPASSIGVLGKGLFAQSLLLLL